MKQTQEYCRDLVGIFTGGTVVDDFGNTLTPLEQSGLAAMRDYAAAASGDLGASSSPWATPSVATHITMRAGGNGSQANTLTGLSPFRTAVLIVTLVSAGVGSGITGQWILQGSADGGLTWFDLCSPATTAPADAANSQFAALCGNAPYSATAPAKTTPGSMAAGTNGAVLATDRVRIWEKVAGGNWSTQPVYSAQIYVKS